MHGVEKTSYVKEESRASAFGPQGALDVVGKCETGVKRARESTGPKLGGGHKSMFVDIVKETF